MVCIDLRRCRRPRRRDLAAAPCAAAKLRSQQVQAGRESSWQDQLGHCKLQNTADPQGGQSCKGEYRPGTAKSSLFACSVHGRQTRAANIGAQDAVDGSRTGGHGIAGRSACYVRAAMWLVARPSFITCCISDCKNRRRQVPRSRGPRNYWILGIRMVRYVFARSTRGRSSFSRCLCMCEAALSLLIFLFLSV